MKPWCPTPIRASDTYHKQVSDALIGVGHREALFDHRKRQFEIYLIATSIAHLTWYSFGKFQNEFVAHKSMYKSVLLHILLIFPFFLSIHFSDISLGEKVDARGVVLEKVSTTDPLTGPDQNFSLPFLCTSLEFISVTSVCQNADEELVSIIGELNSPVVTAQDDFTIYIIHDADEDGVIETGEPILSSIQVSGSVSPGNPLVFNTNVLVDVENTCHLFVGIEADNSDTCLPEFQPIPNPTLLNAGDDQIFCSFSGTELSVFLGTDNCGSLGYGYSWSAIAPAVISDLNDNTTSDPELTIEWADHLGETLTYIVESQRVGCDQPSLDTVNIVIPNAGFGYFPDTNFIFQAQSCQSSVDYCLGISQMDLSDFEVMNNGMLYAGGLEICNGNELAVPLGVGIHELSLTNIISGCSDTISIIVTCPQSDTVELTLTLHKSDTLCLSSFELTGLIDTVLNICPDGSFAEYEIIEDSCVVITGIYVGAENACFIACDTAGFCDTTFLMTTVSHPFPNGIHDTVIISQNSQLCFDESFLNLGGPVATIENICPVPPVSVVDFTINEADHCLGYLGVGLGIDSVCVRLCDALGNCDTVNVLVAVVPGEFVFDTVFVGVESGVFCVNDSLPGNIVSVTNVCADGEEVLFQINGTCVEYFGNAVGQDTACIRVENEFGDIAIYQLIISVVTTTTAVFCDSVFIGEVLEFCLDTTELPGAYDNFEIVCDAASLNVEFLLNPVSLCVRYEGLTLGQDTFCVAVCDEFGICDTTNICITVAPYFERPGLTNDTTSTIKETPIVIGPLSNDTIFGGLQDYFILDPPISGSAMLNLDGSVTYIPDPPFCARWDEFTYVVCNPIGCDTASVSVFIECIELTIFNAVSPNNDDVNDYFYIAKIENFPNNRLWVYNRWGNLVFDSGSEGYKNNWPGTWGDDIDLPDGTYYYILEWSDNDITTVQRGFFEMFR